MENPSEAPHNGINHNVIEEEISIEDLHADVEKKLKDEGFSFDKNKFIFHDKDWTFGERLADKVARFGGSWLFIVLFVALLASYILVNLIWLKNRGWDPYPFILLNLMLSCVASLQAPIIMMSQNRQAIRYNKQQEINLEKDIVDFKQDRLDLILDQKELMLMAQMNRRLKKIEHALAELKKSK
ncbi:MAG: DUF1003 domain-containing protein [archaeon]